MLPESRGGGRDVLLSARLYVVSALLKVGERMKAIGETMKLQERA